MVDYPPHPQNVVPSLGGLAGDRIPARRSKATFISLATVATGITVLLHEAVGYVVPSWVRDDVPAELNGNHLSSLHEDSRVEPGGILANVAACASAPAATPIALLPFSQSLNSKIGID